MSDINGLDDVNKPGKARSTWNNFSSHFVAPDGRVAVHNDYRLAGEDMTFWLMTHASGLYLKGEGTTDLDALTEIDRQARKVFAPVALANQERP